MRLKNVVLGLLAMGLASFTGASLSYASGEASLVLPELNSIFQIGGMAIGGTTLLYAGLVVCVLGMLFGFKEFIKVKKLPAHKSMLDVSSLIYETCKTYLQQQGKLLIFLELFIGACIFYYFKFLQGMSVGRVLMILGWSIIGILGSYMVAWFGIRMNTYANSRTAFASLKGEKLPVMEIPLRAGMSIGVLLICVELILMLTILLLVDRTLAGSCFLGFAIGESLGASVLRVCGGIFTKIADIGSDLMKIAFNIREDDPRNPGVIADCTGDNAGDSIGPTADGFETYGVTGVALITFIILAVMPQFQADLIIWIFTMRILMIVTSIVSFKVNETMTRAKVKNSKNKDDFDFEAPLTSLVWLTSLVSIAVTYVVSYLLLNQNYGDLWWKLSTIISCGTIAAAVIPELTKIFTSSNSKHVAEIVNASREGGASLTILSGLVAGNFSAFWKGLTIAALMLVAYLVSNSSLDQFMSYPAVFAFGLVAFGLLGMGPVTIAVDSYGPVTDNAQSVFELSGIEQLPNSRKEIEQTWNFTPDFAKGKHLLEENDSAGNTFKATAKPVLIGTAVIGATTMIFSLILLLKDHFGWQTIGAELSIIDPQVLLGLICGGAVVYWFCGASMQAVTTGAYRAVEYIKRNIKLDGAEHASMESSKEVVKICTQYAQAGMRNIFFVLFFITIAFACFSPTFFAAYLVSIAIFGLFQAIFMANAGGAWDNAKKYVEVDLKEKGTPLHAATVVGDTVGDPFKDTSSVALNPIIKFTTLFGLLAVEMAIAESFQPYAMVVGGVSMAIALYFVWRSFYQMRISSQAAAASMKKVEAA
jgi:K(+)-stimulated pyrophosphate-energized sodium pump